MKIKAVVFGGSGSTRFVPGVGTQVLRIDVGQRCEPSQGGGVIASLEYDRHLGVVVVRKRTSDGQPHRLWGGQVADENRRTEHTADAIGIALGQGVLVLDDDQPQQPRGGQSRQ